MININPDPAFIIETENNVRVAKLTDSFKNLLNTCQNPKIIMVIGKSREGKSTLLNQLLKDKRNDLGTPRINVPFNARGGEDPYTRNFQFAGPISSRTFCELNNINPHQPPFYDLFFIDSEGTGNIAELSDNLLHGLFLLESITSSLLFVSKGTVENENIRYILRYLQTYKFFSNRNTIEPTLFMIARDVGLPDYDGDLNRLNSLRKNQDQAKKNLLIRAFNERSLLIKRDKLHYFAEMPFDQLDLFWSTIKDIASKIIEVCTTTGVESANTIIENFNRINNVVSEYSDILDPNKPFEDIIKVIFEKELENIKRRLSAQVIQDIRNEIENAPFNQLVTMSFEEYNQRKQNEFANAMERNTNECFTEIIAIVPDVYEHKKGEVLQAIEREVFTLKEQSKERVNGILTGMINDKQRETETQIKESLNRDINGLTVTQLQEISVNDETINAYVQNKINEAKRVFALNAEAAYNSLSTLEQTINHYNIQQSILCLNIETYTKNKLNEKIRNTPPWPTTKEELMRSLGQNIRELGVFTLYYNKTTPYSVQYRYGRFVIPGASVSKTLYKNGSYDSSSSIDHWFDPDTKQFMISDSTVYTKSWTNTKYFLWFEWSKDHLSEDTKFELVLPGFWYIKSYNGSANISCSSNHMTWRGNGGVYNIVLAPRSLMN